MIVVLVLVLDIVLVLVLLVLVLVLFLLTIPFLLLLLLLLLTLLLSYSGLLESVIVNAGYSPTSTIATIKIAGVSLGAISTVTVNGAQVQFTYENAVIAVSGLDVKLEERFTVQWR